MTGPEDGRPVGGLPAWPSVPPAGEPTAPPSDDGPALPADDVPAPPADDPTPPPVSAVPGPPADEPGAAPAVDPPARPVSAVPAGEAPTQDAPPMPMPTPAGPADPLPADRVPLDLGKSGGTDLGAAAPDAGAPTAPSTATATAPAPSTAPAPVPVAEPAPEPGPAAVPAARRRALVPVIALALVVALLGAACVALLLTEQRQGDRADRQLALAVVQDPSGPALRAASTAVETLLSYDYTRLDADFAAGRDLLTPAFAEQYAEFTDKLVRPPALQAKARVVARTQVLAPTEASTADRVVVLAFVDQTTTSALLDAPALDQSRVTLTLEPVDGRWLVADLVVTGSRPGGS